VKTEKTGCGYGYVGLWGSVGMGILWGYPQDFLWVWSGYGDRNSVPTAALGGTRHIFVYYLRKRHLCLWQQMTCNLQFNRYKQLTFDCRAAVRDFECKQETKLIDSQNINNLYKHINRKMRRPNSSSCPVLYDQTGSCVYSDLDKAELFNAHFHSVNVDDNGHLPKFSRRAEANTKLDT